MPKAVLLKKVEKLAANLPPQDQLRLVAQISERLSHEFAGHVNNVSEDKLRLERIAKADALLAELDAIAESIEGEFDSAKDIREIRLERANRI